MMKNKYKRYTIILLCIILLITTFGCTPKPQTGETENNAKIVLGAWEGDTFTNEWANFTFTLPDGMTALTDEEMQPLFNSSDVLINNNYENADSDSVYTYFDFALEDSNGVICVCVYYIDVYKASYVDMKVSTFAERLIQAFYERNPEYTATEIVPDKIGNLDDCISFSVSMNEYVTITYYVNKIDGFFNVWMISEYDRQSDDLDNFLNSVEKIN